MIANLLDSELETLRDERRAAGDIGIAMACSVVLEWRAFPHRHREETAMACLAECVAAWAARAQPIVPRVQTRETQPMRTPTDEEVVAELAARRGVQ